MIVQERPSAELFSPAATSSIVADALTRIPCAHFGEMSRMRASVEACAIMLAQAVAGNRGGVGRWVRDAGATCGAEPLSAVLSAVCGAIVDDAFRSRGTISSVAPTVAAVERDVLKRLNDDRRARELASLADPKTHHLASGLVEMARLHDARTALHLDATAGLARSIAETMHLPREWVARTALAARVHDIGNVGVKHELLSKTAELTAREWTEVRRHAELGAAALADIAVLASLAPIVLAHHERVDGLGYPNGLRADEIPLEARIIAVADAYAALTATRSYRGAAPPNAALAVIAAGAGNQFDGDVVDAALLCLNVSRRAIA